MGDPRPTLAALGGFFALTEPERTDALPWLELLADHHLERRLREVREALARSTGQAPEQVDTKVAMSALQVGLASRLWSVALGSAVLDGWLPDLRPGNLLGSPGHRGAVPLALADPTAGYAAPTARHARDLIGETVVDATLVALDEACATVGKVGRQVLLSNAASSLVGAARVLSRHRADVGPAAWEVTRLLLELPGLSPGGARRRRAELPVGVGGAMEERTEAFVRRGCCLFDRIPEHGLCPDCVRAERRPDLVTPGH